MSLTASQLQLMPGDYDGQGLPILPWNLFHLRL
jgi:hypothetical protein